VQTSSERPLNFNVSCSAIVWIASEMFGSSWMNCCTSSRMIGVSGISLRPSLNAFSATSTSNSTVGSGSFWYCLPRRSIRVSTSGARPGLTSKAAAASRSSSRNACRAASKSDPSLARTWSRMPCSASQSATSDGRRSAPAGKPTARRITSNTALTGWGDPMPRVLPPTTRPPSRLAFARNSLSAALTSSGISETKPSADAPSSK